MGLVGDDGAGWRVAKTNSGEGSREICERKRDFHGAAGVVR